MSWLLRQIVLPGQTNTIDFTWANSNAPWQNRYNETASVRDDCYIANGGSLVAGSMGAAVSWYAPEDFINDKVLTKIQSSAGRVDFTYTSCYLSSMKVYNPSNILVRNISFTINDRLLREVTIDVDKYKFEYNAGRFASMRSQDYWGYYNGMPNQAMYPQMTLQVKHNGVMNNEVHGSASKAISASAMQANILTKITYPTGGYTTYTYEPHRFSGTALNEGGGLRVTSMATRADANATPITTTYKYGLGESGLGECTIEPNLSTFVQEQYVSFTEVSPSQAYTFRQRTLLPYSQVMSYLAFTLPVWYKEVTEYTGEGKIVRTYDYQPDEKLPFYVNGSFNMVWYGPVEQSHPQWVIIKYRNIFQQGPRMTGQNVYKKNGAAYTIVEKDTFIYTNYVFAQNLEGIHVYRYINYINFPYDWDYGNAQIYLSLYFTGKPYIYRHSEVELMKKKLTSTINTSYRDGNAVSITTNYTYNPNRLYALTSETKSNSQSGVLKNDYLYAQDNLSELTVEQKQYAVTMDTTNRITTPLLVKTYNNGVLTGREVIKYTHWGNNLLLPEKHYFQHRSDVAEEVRVTYSKYDTRGNPLYIVRDDAESVVYLWGYNYQYPIAEIKGATYDQVKTALAYNDTQMEALFAQIVPDVNWVDNKLRTYFNNSVVSLVTTYTYKPLAGVLTVKDPRGVVTSYIYDNYGRLTDIAREGKNIEKYIYNYRN